MGIESVLRKRGIGSIGFVALSLLGVVVSAVGGQEGEEVRRLLDVRRRQIELRLARQEVQRLEELFRQGVIPKTKLDQARVELEKAQLAYQEAVLALLALEPRISVRRAVKYQAADGRRFVRLTVVNLTPTFDDAQFRLLQNFEGADPIPEELRQRDVRDIFISLKDPGEPLMGAGAGASLERSTRGTTISLPYEVHIPRLNYGEEQTLTFQLLRDVPSVIVAVSYKGRTLEHVVQLQQAEGESVVLVSSTQFSQEADLGGQATYDLRIERSTVDVRSFQLKVVNLPRQITYSFLDPNTQARLSQITFPAGVTEQRLSLRLFLPERADERVRMDEPLEFWALVGEEGHMGAFRDDRMYSAREIAAARVGRVRLVVIPRGVGRIEVLAASLFSEISVGQSVQTRFVLRNVGTRRLDNIKLSAEYPLNWRVEVEPAIIPALEINREAEVRVHIIPPPDVPVGEYEVRLKTESFASGRRVQSEDKIYRVSVRARADVWTTAALIGGLLALVIGIVIFGVRLTRR
jgi:hypothetical protein